MVANGLKCLKLVCFRVFRRGEAGITTTEICVGGKIQQRVVVSFQGLESAKKDIYVNWYHSSF